MQMVFLSDLTFLENQKLNVMIILKVAHRKLTLKELT